MSSNTEAGPSQSSRRRWRKSGNEIRSCTPTSEKPVEPVTVICKDLRLGAALEIVSSVMQDITVPISVKRLSTPRLKEKLSSKESPRLTWLSVSSRGGIPVQTNLRVSDRE